MSCWDNISAAELCPIVFGKINHIAKFLAAERKERFEGNAEVGNQLERDVQDGFHTFWVGLPYLPRLAFGNVAIAYSCQVHCFFLCFAELEHVEIAFYFLLHVFEFLNSLTVYVLQFATRWNNAVPIFMCQLQRTVHEVAIDCHELAVVALLEILPRKVVVFRFWRIGSKHIAQHVLLVREVHQVFVQPYRPITACRNLVVLKIQEFV